MSAQKPSAASWWVLAAMIPPLIALTLDFFGAAVALPTIGRDLDASTSGLSWVINSYMLAFAAPLIAVGRLADIIGRRKVLIAGIVLFTIGSIASGAAPDLEVMILGRVIQGIGAAMFYSTSLSLVSNAFSRESRGTAIGLWTAVGSIGSAIGPLIGGVFTQELSWRWFFFLNIPICIAAIALVLWKVKESRDETAERSIDITGFILVTVGLVAVVLGIQEIDTSGWESINVLGPLVGGLVLLAVFAVVELHKRNPLVDFKLFRNRDYLGSSLVAFTANVIFGAMIFFVTLYLQEALDYDPVSAGLVMLGFSLPFAIMSPIAGRLMVKFGAGPLMVFGMFGLAVSCTLFALIEPDSGVDIAVIAMVLSGVFQGFAYNVSTTAAMSAISEQKAGIASGVLSSIRIFAITFGVAGIGVVVKSFENTKLADFAGLSGDARSEVAGLLSGSISAEHKLTELSPQLAGKAEGLVREAFVSGFSAGMWVCAVVALIGTVGAFFVHKHVTAPDQDPEVA